MTDVTKILKDIENSFADIKRKDDVSGSIKSIKMALAKLKVDIKEITIVPTQEGSFFGMSIFPPQEVIDNIVNCMISKKPLSAYSEIWNSNKEWIIEIDEALLYDPQLNTNPAELTAALLHEIGHTVYSNSIPEKLHKVLSYTFLNLPTDLKIMIKSNHAAFKSLFKPIVAQASLNLSYSIKKEMEADKYVVKMGYGEALESLLQKLLVRFGSETVNNTDRELEQNLKIAAQWSRAQVSDLTIRKIFVRESINKITNRTHSPYIRELFENINRKIFKGPTLAQVANRENRDKYVAECVNLPDETKGLVLKSVLESAKNSKFNKYGKLEKVTQHDVDIISIQIDKIQNENDKIYLLDVIYDYLETLDLAVECLENGKKDAVQMSSIQIKSIRQELQELRKRVMDFKIVEKQYGVFIKYPVGYEG